MTQNSKTGATFIAGAGVSATVGGMGLAGGFGAVGIGATPVVAAGAVVGALSKRSHREMLLLSVRWELVQSAVLVRKISSLQMDTIKFHRTFFYLSSPYSQNGFVNSVAYSPDGAILASGATDKTIRIWGRYMGTIKRTLNAH